MAKLLSVSQFATQIGVSRQAVDKAIKMGKLTIAESRGRFRFIDVEKGRGEWQQNKLKKKIKNKIKKEIPPPKPAETYQGLTLYSAQLREKIAIMKIQELKAAEQEGRLIDADVVKQSAFEVWRKVRDNLLNIPTKIGHALAAETNPQKVEVMIQRELISTLQEITKREVDIKGNVKSEA